MHLRFRGNRGSTSISKGTVSRPLEPCTVTRCTGSIHDVFFELVLENCAFAPINNRTLSATVMGKAPGLSPPYKVPYCAMGDLVSWFLRILLRSLPLLVLSIWYRLTR
ncbi:hypothetical protein PAXRUDRAFT_608930 [Paxillus rubicundulus Ve08.2h10]|uniref:Uncharacterized protein n=1 Tax=Paxillus rubicundulus Ve08.2h10 TaxID=930991 RepID=A0A0D0E3X5_9AGAM|nr:hypothetical protein PAXRUDRAFT_608930 [Paxillus rubicundulus Ve08.2h10]